MLIMNNINQKNQRVYEWIAKNRDKHNKRMALYMREYNKINPNNYASNQRCKILELLGDKCVKCGFSDKKALCLDHIKGDGCIERLTKTGIKMYNYYLGNQKELKENIQILCANCNMIKKIENKEYSMTGRKRKY